MPLLGLVAKVDTGFDQILEQFSIHVVLKSRGQHRLGKTARRSDPAAGQLRVV
jgi:hypothetical protein